MKRCSLYSFLVVLSLLYLTRPCLSACPKLKATLQYQLDSANKTITITRHTLDTNQYTEKDYYQFSAGKIILLAKNSIQLRYTDKDSTLDICMILTAKDTFGTKCYTNDTLCKTLTLSHRKSIDTTCHINTQLTSIYNDTTKVIILNLHTTTKDAMHSVYINDSLYYYTSDSVISHTFYSKGLYNITIINKIKNCTDSNYISTKVNPNKIIVKHESNKATAKWCGNSTNGVIIQISENDDVDQEFSLVFYDVSGKQIADFPNIHSGKNAYALGNLSKGIYYFGLFQAGSRLSGNKFFY